MFKVWFCRLFWHDWDMHFQDEDKLGVDDPFRWIFVCKRCGKQTNNMKETMR